MTAPKPAPYTLFRALPSVDTLLTLLENSSEIHRWSHIPRAMLKEGATCFLDAYRKRIGQSNTPESACAPTLLAGIDKLLPDPITAKDVHIDTFFPRLTQFLDYYCRPRFRRVLNATGVVIHTNMGRSLLSKTAIQAIVDAATYYSNLELNLDTGKRGSRYSHVEELICRLVGTESALVVNNNAAAVLLTLDSLCKGGEVIVSRGQLVEIGGSFRIPDVISKSGCILKEVGATNKTHLFDYENALSETTKALLKVHTSNYRISGFTSEVPVTALATLAAQHQIPLIEDLGSGFLYDFEKAGIPALAGEPSAQQVVAAGVDVVTFSGDKVLGGPQAGIIAGRKKYLDLIKKNPLHRALRLDKMTLAALEATLRLYLDPALAIQEIPTLRMLCIHEKELQKLAKKLTLLLEKKLDMAWGVTTTVRQGASKVGGGAFPERNLPTFLVAIEGIAPELLRQHLLTQELPLMGRVEQNAFLLDPRTLLPEELPLVANAIAVALTCLCQQKNAL